MQLPYPVRRFGQSVLGQIPIRIRSGVNRGLRWSLASAGRGYVSGTFARDRIQVLATLVRPGECFFDLGAHKGFMTLAAASLVGPTGVVVCVEPATSNLVFLRRHLRWNGLGPERVRVVQAAVGGIAGEVLFGGRGDSLAFAVGRGDERVPRITLADLPALTGAPPPTALKLDIEGAEAETLATGLPILSPGAFLLISVHSRELYEATSTLLSAADFILLPSKEIRYRIEHPNEPWGGDHELLAVGPGRPVDRTRLERLPLFAAG